MLLQVEPLLVAVLEEHPPLREHNHGFCCDFSERLFLVLGFAEFFEVFLPFLVSHVSHDLFHLDFFASLVGFHSEVCIG